MSALEELITPPVEQIELWPLERVLPNPLNPRGELMPEGLDELAASILEHGILTPLLAVPAGDFVHLVAGHRRRAAAERAGLREVPVILHRFTPLEQLEIMLVENIQRKDLSPLQEARGFHSLIQAGLRQRDVARRLSIHPVRVSQGLALLKLDETVARAFDNGDLPLRLTTEFARLSDPLEQRRYAMLALQRQVKAAELADYMRQQQSAETHLTTLARQGTDAPAGACPRPGADEAKERSPVPAARREPQTRSQAAALLSGEETVSFAMLRRALAYACRGCDEDRFPAICRACPIPRFIANLVAEVRRADG